MERLVIYYRTTAVTALRAIAKARHELAEAQQLFAETPEVGPMEWEEIRERLQTLRETVEALAQLLHDSSHLPLELRHNRYELFVSLNHVSGQIGPALSRLAAFRLVCLEATRERYRLYEQIERKLRTLLRASEHLEPEGQEFLSKLGRGKSNWLQTESGLRI